MAPTTYENSSPFNIQERRFKFESPFWRQKAPLTLKNYKTTFGIEEEFDLWSTQKWMADNWTLSIYIIGFYLYFIRNGQACMKMRGKILEVPIRRVLVVWNVSLAIFSIIGSYRSVPEVYYIFNRDNGFYYSCCFPVFKHNNVATFWAWLFVLSKAVELGDTVFVVIRKQKLQFLHWYHHVTVLLYTWYSYAEYIAPSRWYVAVNYLIHSFMYSYFALRAMGIRIPRPIAVAITSSQMFQMVIGVAANVKAFYAKEAGLDCDVSYFNIYLSFLMYASYFLLFANFFRQAYLTKSREIEISTKDISENKNRIRVTDAGDGNGTGNGTGNHGTATAMTGAVKLKDSGEKED